MKLVSTYEYRKDGSRNTKAYKITLRKVECEKHGFNADTEFEAEYFDDKIILTKKSGK